MTVAVMTFRLRAPWVHSLKEKRMIVKSLTAKLQNTFHVSAAEVDEQDTHQIIVIGVAAIVPHNAMADSLMEEISLFVEENCEAEILEEEREIRYASSHGPCMACEEKADRLRYSSAKAQRRKRFLSRHV